MTKAEKIQEEINRIISSVKARGWRMNRTTKKALARIDELGLTDYLPAWMVRHGEKADAIINEIIKQAEDAGHLIGDAGFNADGEGFDNRRRSEASQLWALLNSDDDDDDDNDDNDDTSDRDLAPDVMTAAEAGTRWQLAPATVRQAINRGKLQARKSGNTWLVSKQDMIAWMGPIEFTPHQIEWEYKPYMPGPRKWLDIAAHYSGDAIGPSRHYDGDYCTDYIAYYTIWPDNDQFLLSVRWYDYEWDNPSLLISDGHTQNLGNFATLGEAKAVAHADYIKRFDGALKNIGLSNQDG